MEIKLLTGNEWRLWKNIRLEALKNTPEAFGSSLGESANAPESVIRTSIFLQIK